MSLKNFMIESANILFDDSKNDLRALPKTVRLQILLVLSFIWSVVFSLYIFTYTTFIFGWAGVFLAHLGLIFAVYHTFKQFHKAEEKSASVFETKNFNPFKKSPFINAFSTIKIRIKPKRGIRTLTNLPIPSLTPLAITDAVINIKIECHINKFEAEDVVILNCSSEES